VTDRCSTRCDHDSQCTLPGDHEPADRHETDHGCICYDSRRYGRAWTKTHLGERPLNKAEAHRVAHKLGCVVNIGSGKAGMRQRCQHDAVD
jgi:hypothetical protein